MLDYSCARQNSKHIENRLVFASIGNPKLYIVRLVDSTIDAAYKTLD